MSYEWKENYVCTPVFAIFRSERMLDQQTIPSNFAGAGETKLGSLTYYPRTSTDATLLDNQATMVANMFVNYMENLGVFSGLEAEGKTLRDVKNELKAVLKDGDKKLVDFAQALDALVKFIDE